MILKDSQLADLESQKDIFTKRRPDNDVHIKTCCDIGNSVMSHINPF